MSEFPDQPGSQPGASAGSPAGSLPRVRVVGDPYYPAAAFRRGLAELDALAEVSYLDLPTTAATPARTASEQTLREYAGDPAQVTAATAGHQILVVHGAAVSAETLNTPGLRLVCCARGGPVNVDVAAATQAGVLVCNTPGKNAEAVADLAITFVLMVLRKLAPAARDLVAAGRPSDSVFDGLEYFGLEASGATLGIIGYGHIGRQVAARARALGLSVLVHDPYVQVADGEQVTAVGLAELLAGSDVVSLHARGGADGPLLGADEFAAMRPGAALVNTAREQLVDEDALHEALACGRLSGAALDVVEPGAPGTRNRLLDLPSVFATPHIGGTTDQTLDRGTAMVLRSVRAHLLGEVPPFLVNPQVLEAAAEPVGGRR